MSDSDPDYVPTASQLDHDDSESDQDFDDFDSDIDDLSLCSVSQSDRDSSWQGRFDVGISDLIPATQIPKNTPRSTRAKQISKNTPRSTRASTWSSESAHDRSVRTMNQTLSAASDDFLFPPEDLTTDCATGKFSISNILYGKTSASLSDRTPSSSTCTPSPDREREMEKIVSRLLTNTVPENTLKKNVTALNAFRDFALTDETVKAPWEELPLSRMPNALVRFVAARGGRYDQRTFHSLLGGMLFFNIRIAKLL